MMVQNTDIQKDRKSDRQTDTQIYPFMHTSSQLLLWQHFLLGKPLMACGHKIFLWENIYYGVYVLEKDILIGGHILQKKLFHGRICLTVEHVIQYDMSYGRVCLTG